MDEDAEVIAIGRISEILSALTSDQAARVVRWAAERYGIAIGTAASEDGSDPSGVWTDADSIGRFFEAADPQTEQERALIVAYWHQVMRGCQGLDALQINGALKHLGCGAKNITRALQGLMQREPPLVVQTRKAGSTRQARKTYRLTADGIQHVNRILRSPSALRLRRSVGSPPPAVGPADSDGGRDTPRPA